VPPGFETGARAEIQHARTGQVFHRLRILELRQAPHHVGDARRLLEDDAQLLALIVAHRRVHQQQLGVAEERGEGIVDLVLDGDRRLADPGEPPGPGELRLRSAARGVLKDALAGDLDPRAQVFRGARLGDVVVGAGGQDGREVVACIARRDHEDEALPSRLVLANETADGESIELGHADVEHDEGRRRLLVECPRMLAVLGGHRLVPKIGEHGREQRASHFIVVSEENAHGCGQRNMPARTAMAAGALSVARCSQATATRRPRTAVRGALALP
jgi:hypothetical protein